MVGQNIGKYQVLDRIGRGGMGTVYRAMDETLRREVAIKVLNAELNDPAVAKRFHAEAITVARLNHPGIATVYELFQNEGQWLMVMEFVRGETLEGLVKRTGPLGLDRATDISMQALGALAHAHSLGVVHRDLKPANLMAGESGLVKIMDFGIARVAGTEHLTSAGFMMGTPAYMAPEQVLGEDIDARCDIYAMGAVLFYLLTAQLPFKGKSPFEMAQAHLRDQPILLRTVRADMPEWVEQVIDRALQRDPQKRFPSAPQFHDALRRGLSGLPIDTPAAGSVPADAMITAPPGGMAIASGLTGATATPAPPGMMETVLQSPSRTGAPVISTIPSSTGLTESATPVVGGTVAAPVSTATSPLVTPDATAATMASPQSFASVPPAPSTAASVGVLPRAKSSPLAPLAIVAAVVLLAGVGGFVWTRARNGAPAQPTVATNTAAPEPVAAAPEPAPVVTPPAEPPPGASTVVTPNPSATASSAAPSTTVPTTPSTTAPATTPGTTTGRGVTASRDGRAASTATRGATAAPVTPAPAAVDPPETFKDVRLLVIAGKKADERPVVLRFGYGFVSALSERDGIAVESIPDKDISYAAYARAKDPLLSPVLAKPPADTDFPGGLFRSARHWLTLQSRSAFLIIRLNDADVRRVLDTVTRRITVKLEMSTPAPSK